ncbi:MAG TPA: hypothetical protein VNK25_00510 [Candidatus Nitrosotenuis sp.]|nr:hypothetical protein [Candidatus Nitrosotenuis sp.]
MPELLDRKGIRQELDKMADNIYWDKNGIIQSVTDNIVILCRMVGAQKQFIAAFDHFTKLGYELKAIDEGSSVTLDGAPNMTGGLRSYYYLQKLSKN